MDRLLTGSWLHLVYIFSAVMTAVGESQDESQNFVSEGYNFSKKRKKQKNQDSGEDPVYEAPIKSALGLFRYICKRLQSFMTLLLF